MPPKTTAKSKKKTAQIRAPRDVAALLAVLKRLGSASYRSDMSARYGITGPSASTAFGTPMSKLQQVAQECIRDNGRERDHDLALALWSVKGPGQYEARMLASLVDDPQQVTAAQMDRWCRDFDNWGIADTVCFKLFDQVSPELAFGKVDQWATHKGEFQKRAAFALLACLALHNRSAELNDRFEDSLSLIERVAADDRNFVKKSISWALRGIAGRSPALKSAVAATGTRLAASTNPGARWVGKDVMKALGKGSK